MDKVIKIENESIILRSLNCQDSEKYRLLRNDEEVRKYFYHNGYISKEAQMKWYEKYKDTTDDYMFSVFLKQQEVYVGGVALYNIDFEAKSAEVGRIIIDKSQKGNGLGSEAINCIVEWGNGRLGITRFYASIYANNYASRKTFERCGFTIVSEQCSKVLVEKIFSRDI